MKSIRSVWQHTVLPPWSFFGLAQQHAAVYGPIALVVVGGLCTSTLLTLLLLPAMYALLDEGSAVVRQLRYHLQR